MVGAIGGWLRVTVRNLSLDGAMPEVCNPTFVMIVSGCSQSSSSASEIATLGYRRLSVDCEWGLTNHVGGYVFDGAIDHLTLSLVDRGSQPRGSGCLVVGNSVKSQLIVRYGSQAGRCEWLLAAFLCSSAPGCEGYSQPGDTTVEVIMCASSPSS